MTKILNDFFEITLAWTFDYLHLFALWCFGDYYIFDRPIGLQTAVKALFSTIVARLIIVPCLDSICKKPREDTATTSLLPVPSCPNGEEALTQLSLSEKQSLVPAQKAFPKVSEAGKATATGTTFINLSGSDMAGAPLACQVSVPSGSRVRVTYTVRR